MQTIRMLSNIEDFYFTIIFITNKKKLKIKFMDGVESKGKRTGLEKILPVKSEFSLETAHFRQTSKVTLFQF